MVTIGRQMATYCSRLQQHIRYGHGKWARAQGRCTPNAQGAPGLTLEEYASRHGHAQVVLVSGGSFHERVQARVPCVPIHAKVLVIWRIENCFRQPWRSPIRHTRGGVGWKIAELIAGL